MRPNSARTAPAAVFGYNNNPKQKGCSSGEQPFLFSVKELTKYIIWACPAAPSLNCLEQAKRPGPLPLLNVLHLAAAGRANRYYSSLVPRCGVSATIPHAI